MTDGKRLVQAIFISPLAALPIRLADMAVTGILWQTSIGPQLTVVLISALVGVLFFGLPVHFLMARMQLTHPVFYAILGFLAPAAYVLFWLDLSEVGIGFAVHIIGLVGVSGACVALAFRYFAIGAESSNKMRH